jgi:hypothetical protein
MSLAEKRRLADYVVENDGSLEDLERQVQEVLGRIKATSPAPDTSRRSDPRVPCRPPE